MCMNVVETFPRPYFLGFVSETVSSSESQKDVNAVQRCSVEIQKGAFVIDFVQP